MHVEIGHCAAYSHYVERRPLGQDIYFRVLGSLQVCVDDEPLHIGGPRHERALAVLLLGANRVTPIPRLIEAMWGERPPSTATHQTRKMVLDLRHRLPGGDRLIHTDGPGYRLAIDDGQLDLREFDGHLATARAAQASGDQDAAIAHLRAAVELWRGPALAGLDGPVIRPAATALDERHLAATEQLMELRLAAGEGRELVAELQELVGEHPLREGLRAHLMVALCRAGRQAEALRVFADGRRLLSEELGIDPGRELVRRYEQILHNDPELEAPAAPAPLDARHPFTLPYDISDFTGRAAELGHLLHVVHTAPPHGLTIVAVDGMAGIGKTTFAVHAAHKVAADYPDGQLFIDLHGFTPGHDPVDPAAALDTLLRAVGVPGGQIPDTVAARSAMWREHAAGRRILLLLDNAVDTAQIRPLLPGAPGCLMLITSRSRLASLDGAAAILLNLPPPEDGSAMISRVLGAERAVAEPGAVDQLVEACGRLPLAMRIAAARLNNRPGWTVHTMLDRLRNAERALGELAIDDRSVAATIQLSYKGLDGPHQRLFRLLGLHPGTDFDGYAAAALAGLPLDKAEVLLEDLLDARLLLQRRVDRYTFHDLLRSYAQQAVRAEESLADIATASHRLIDYYLQVAATAGDLIQPGAQRLELDFDFPPADVPTLTADTAFEWLDAERANLLAVIHNGTGNGLDLHACHLAHSISRYLHIRGHVQDQAELLRSAVDSARRLSNSSAELYSLVNLFVALWHFGRYREAYECAEQALEISRRTGDRRREGISLGNLGTCHAAAGRLTTALRHHTAALAIHRELGNRLHESATLAGLSAVLGTIGNHDEALDSARAALAIAREVGNDSRNVFALISVATAYANLDNPESASIALSEALVRARRMEMPTAEAMVLARYVDVYRRLGQYEDARQAGARAGLIFTTVQRPANAAMLENLLGRVRLDLSDYHGALARHRKALEIATAIEHRIEVARALDGIGCALHGLGNLPAAADHWQRAITLYDEIGMPEAVAARTALESITTSDEQVS